MRWIEHGKTTMMADDDLSQEWFLDIIGEMYEAVMDLSRLPNVLERVMHGLGSESAILRLQNHVDHSVGFNIYFGYEPEWRAAYQKYYKNLDPYPEALRSIDIRMTICETLLPKDELIDTEYYNDFLRPQGKLHCLGGFLLKTEDYYIQLGFQRGVRAKPYNARSLLSLNLLAPHFRRVLKQNQHFADLNKHQKVSEYILDLLPYGIIIFAEQGKVMVMNRCADEILSSDFGLKLTSQGICAPVLAESKQLQTMIRQGLQLAAGKGALPRNSLSLTPIGVERHPIHAVVIPLRPESRGGSLGVSSPRVMLLLSTLDQPSTALSTVLLQNLFGLTAAEAYLARELALGHDLEEVAEVKRCTRHTVRNQLKAVFAKTGTSRQAELVRLLLSLPGSS
ncbi:MAG: helix-turn-helix transcriptional regulator [Magnetococcus sp. YQC-9]